MLRVDVFAGIVLSTAHADNVGSSTERRRRQEPAPTPPTSESSTGGWEGGRASSRMQAVLIEQARNMNHNPYLSAQPQDWNEIFSYAHWLGIRTKPDHSRPHRTCDASGAGFRKGGNEQTSGQGQSREVGTKFPSHHNDCCHHIKRLQGHCLPFSKHCQAAVCTATAALLAMQDIQRFLE